MEEVKFSFEQKLADSIKEYPKSFYAYISSKQKVNDVVGPLRDEDCREIEEVTPLKTWWNC